MLIDFDNVTLGIRSDLQNQLRRLLNSDIFKGKVSVQRAYADWRRYPQYIVPLSEASIDLIFAPAFGTNKKNATDIRLAIDALELVFTRPEIGTFVLLSGDSDFSSLVLKLKEYGKYVIGVGIRESSSDLLIQNCDEYFSYNELTGLAKESDVEHVRQDPWQLVVQAVTQMRQRGDVMRSDRLKQVMQEIDPGFDEKDAGFSRFSKFVVEAGQRGLLKLTKMENGQYEIDLGTNANVSPEVEEALRREPREAPTSRGPRRGRPPRERAAPSGTVTLAAAFGLLKDALLELNAVGGEATDADQVRERMMERSGTPDDPIFERTRFQRLLRQANDAGLIDLVKSGEVYLLKLNAPDAPVPVEEPAEHAATDGAEPRPPRRRGERGGARRGGRGGGRGRRQGEERPEPQTPPSPPPPSPQTPPARSHEPAGGAPRNPRFRHGSRRGGPAPAPASGGAEPASPPPALPPAPPPPPPTFDRAAASAGGRSLRLRTGSRGGGPRPPTPPEPSPRPASGGAPPTPRRAEPQASAPPPPPPPPPPPRAEEPADGEQPSLLKRMSSALQRAVRRGSGGASGKHTDD